MNFDLFLNINYYNNSLIFYKNILCLNKAYSNFFYKNQNIFNNAIIKYFGKINITKNKDYNNNKKILKYLLILELYHKNKTLKFLNLNKEFNVFINNNFWAKNLINYNFQRKIYRNDPRKYYDNTIKENVEDIMHIIYFTKILNIIEENQKNNVIEKQTKYDIGISFYKLKLDLLEISEFIKEDMYDYIQLNYPKFKFI
jgi:hypothetical protein